MKKVIVCLLVLALLCAVGISLFACKSSDKAGDSADENLPATLEEARTRLVAAGYDVGIENVEGDEEYAEMGIIGFVYVNDEECYLYAVLFESAAKASGHFSMDKDDWTEGAKELEEEYGKTVIVKQSGAWLYTGTENVVKAFKTPVKAESQSSTSHVPATAGEAEINLEKAGYAVWVDRIIEDIAVLMGAEGAKAQIVASKIDGEELEEIDLILFDSSTNAKAYYVANEGNLKESADKNGKQYVYGQCGIWVYKGAEDAFIAFKTKATDLDKIIIACKRNAQTIAEQTMLFLCGDAESDRQTLKECLVAKLGEKEVNKITWTGGVENMTAYELEVSENTYVYYYLQEGYRATITLENCRAWVSGDPVKD